MNNTEDVTMTGEASTNYFGESVSSAGDVNGDGYSDVIIGANGFNSNTGKAYLFFGGTSMNNTPDAAMTGEATNNFFGASVSSAGDVNGDGYSDVIIEPLSLMQVQAESICMITS
ncbi:MAG: FG-GAP repeat protein [Ignavibacteria bacterium]|nr:FG-GAP repeat protein [Ignavibacteria bacterium]